MRTLTFATPTRGQKDKSRALFEQMSQVIFVQTGRKISAAMLARYRGIGNAFPQRGLIPEGVSFSALEAAKTPELLARIMEKLPDGEILTREFARETLTALNPEDLAEERKNLLARPRPAIRRSRISRQGHLPSLANRAALISKR
jgi:hypothetical protein